MSRIVPVGWEALVKIFEADGFTQERNSASHIVLSKPGVDRPVIIPRYSEIGVHIIRSNMRTAGMSRKRYLKLLQGKH